MISLANPDEQRLAFQTAKGNDILETVRLVELQAPPTEFVTDVKVQRFEFVDPVADAGELQISDITFNGTSVDLTWTDSVADVAYQVERATTLPGPFVPIGDVTSDLTFTDSDLNGATRLFYRVRRIETTEEDN